nr:MAG TPA: hypothetical protein [Caudoviricetes sp.]
MQNKFFEILFFLFFVKSSAAMKKITAVRRFFNMRF